MIACEEEIVVPSKRRGKPKLLPADLPRIEVIPMQICVIKHVRKVYGCRDCESAPDVGANRRAAESACDPF